MLTIPQVHPPVYQSDLNTSGVRAVRTPHPLRCNWIHITFHKGEPRAPVSGSPQSEHWRVLDTREHTAQSGHAGHTVSLCHPSECRLPLGRLRHRLTRRARTDICRKPLSDVRRAAGPRGASRGVQMSDDEQPAPPFHSTTPLRRETPSKALRMRPGAR